MKKFILGFLVCFTVLYAAEQQLKTFRFDGFEVIAVKDADTSMRHGLFRSLPEAEFRRMAGGDAAAASVNTFLLKMDGKYILADTGNGGTKGSMLKNLKKAGVAPEQIEAVLLTHMHGDHIGGLVDESGKAVFPRAKLYISVPECDYWRRQAAAGKAEIAGKVFQSYKGRIETFEFGKEIIPGIKTHDGSGHTPGHTVFEVGPLLIIGDLLHAAAIQIPRPDICASYDMDVENAVKARKRFYDFAASRDKTAAGMHLPYPGTGKISRDGQGKYSYTPLK